MTERIKSIELGGMTCRAMSEMMRRVKSVEPIAVRAGNELLSKAHVTCLTKVRAASMCTRADNNRIIHTLQKVTFRRHLAVRDSVWIRSAFAPRNYDCLSLLFLLVAGRL